MAFYGVYRGVVTDNNDPHGFGRLRVKLPIMASDSWAMVALPAVTGPSAKIQIGATVVVAFEGGDPDYPVVLGRFPIQSAVTPHKK